jgi:resuscitation-promoting factor RpfB
VFRFPRLHLYIIAILLLTAACEPALKRVVLLSDGQRRVIDTNAVTVQDVLREQKLPLGDNDRAEPPLFAEIGRSTTITITRVLVKTDTATQSLPFSRQLVRDETYPQGQVRIVQLGTNGTVVITYTTTIENGVEAARRETGRKVTIQPRDEILAVGTQGSIGSTPISSGTIAYIANGNAWVMRYASGEKRPLTSSSDLDGRVFSLSLDGRYLLFTRAAGSSANTLNSLWVVETLVLGDAPRSLSLKDVMSVQWSPDSRTIAFSTGEKTVGAPGWKAHNDLGIAQLALTDKDPSPRTPMQVWLASDPAPYGWWGANIAWAPDGHAIAYAFASEVGVIEIDGLTPPKPANPAPRRTLKRFAPFRTGADWVWVPQVAWSPDSRFVISAVHAPLDNPDVASDDPTFEVWALARDGSLKAALAKQTGMWARPAWSPPDARGESSIAYGVALAPSNSEKSRYGIFVMDRDGGNKKQIFPQAKEEGLVTMQMAWSPDARQLVAVRDNDLWLYDFQSAKWSQLTANGASSFPRWAK